jgi:arabinose-5-phosphate isomerase
MPRPGRRASRRRAPAAGGRDVDRTDDALLGVRPAPGYSLEHLVGLEPHAVAREVARLEAAAVADLAGRFGAAFDRAVALLAALGGRLIVSGAGKSGLLAQRLAATLTATGTPAGFLHPADAVHGDLGIVRAGDAVLLISKGGETEELVRLLPALERIGAPLLVLTGDPASTLARAATIVLDHGRPREACPHGLAPTSSITAAGVVGDALAVALMLRRGTSLGDLALLHPAGLVGRSATTPVRAIMHQGSDLPLVLETVTLREALGEIVSKRLGMTTVVDDAGRLTGVLTDGDLKRILLRHGEPLALRVGDVMVRTPRTIDGGALIADAVRAMEENEPSPITSLVIVDAAGRPAGVVHLHDCLRPARG